MRHIFRTRRPTNFKLGRRTKPRFAKVRGNKNVGCGTWKRRFFALAVRITRKLLKIDRYMLRGVWRALNCLSIHATYCVIIAGASPGETKTWAVVRENGDFCTCGSNNWETVEDRWVHAVSGLASIELSFHSCSMIATGASPGQTKNKGRST